MFFYYVGSDYHCHLCQFSLSFSIQKPPNDIKHLKFSLEILHLWFTTHELCSLCTCSASLQVKTTLQFFKSVLFVFVSPQRTCARSHLYIVSAGGRLSLVDLLPPSLSPTPHKCCALRTGWLWMAAPPASPQTWTVMHPQIWIALPCLSCHHCLLRWVWAFEPMSSHSVVPLPSSFWCERLSPCPSPAQLCHCPSCFGVRVWAHVLLPFSCATALLTYLWVVRIMSFSRSVLPLPSHLGVSMQNRTTLPSLPPQLHVSDWLKLARSHPRTLVLQSHELKDLVPGHIHKGKEACT